MTYDLIGHIIVYMKPKIIETRQELHWHVISNYLDDISNFWVANTDEAFKKLLKNIKDYVDGKLTLNGNGEVIDLYVTVLQKSDE